MAEAAKRCTYGAEYLSLLARQRKLSAKKVDDVWYTTLEALEEYVQKQEILKYKDKKDKVWLTMAEASRKSPHGAEYLSLLARQEKLFAKKIGDVWYTTEEALSEYVKKQEILKSKKEKKDVEVAKIAKAPIRNLGYLFDQVEVEKIISSPKKFQTLPLALASLLLLVGLATTQKEFLATLPVGSTLSQSASSLLAQVPTSLDFFINGFNNLRDIALGRTPTLVSLPPPTSQTLVSKVEPLDLSSLRSGLQSELESYIRTQLSNLKPQAPVTVNQYSTTYNPAILLADTRLREDAARFVVAEARPIVTRQSNTDAERRSALFNSLSENGTFTNPTLTGATVSGPSGSFTSLGFSNATGTSLYLSGSLSVAGDTTTIGQLLSTRIPTLAHVFTTWPAGTSNASDATIYINPASAAADTNIFAAAVAGTVKFLVDAEGDVYANNLVLSGSTSQGATTIAGNLTVQDHTTLGDSSSDLTTLNSQLLVLASTTLQNFTFNNATGTSATTTNLYSTTASSTNLFSSLLSVGGSALNVVASGNVGIGTTNPSSSLEVKVSTGGTSPTSVLSAVLGDNSTYTDGIFSIKNAGNRGTLGHANGSPLFVASFSDATAMIIDKSGNVGIGTTGPQSKLSVSGDIATVGADTNTGYDRYLKLYGNTDPATNPHRWAGMAVYNNGGNNVNELGFFVGTGDVARTDAMHIKYDGNVGIGTTGPGGKLDVRDGKLVLSDADVAHGMTTLLATDIYAQLYPSSDTAGGLLVRGSSDAGSVSGIEIQGFIGNNDPTDSVAAIALNGYKKDAGTSVAALGSFETVFSLTNAGTSAITVLGSGNVGIGTTNPLRKLHVSDGGGNTSLGATQILVGSASNVGYFAGIGFGWQGSSNAAGSIGLIATDASGNVYGDLIFNTRAVTTDTAPTEKLRITSAGYVGINTTGPTRLLDVASAITHSGNGTASQLSVRGSADSTQKLNVGYDTTSNYGFIEAVDESTAWQNLILQGFGGTVGIGTTNPSSAAHLQIGTNSAFINLGGNATANGWGGIRFIASNSSTNWFIAQNDTVGAALEFIPSTAGGGTTFTTPTMYLTAGAGTVSFGAWTYNSDIRFKENVEYMEGINALSLIAQLKPATFDYIEGAKNNAGFIAQDVQGVFPLMVTEGANDRLGLKVTEMIPYLVKAIQEVASITGLFKDNLIAWLADTTNGITTFFAQVIHSDTVYTKTICVGNPGTETCVTQAQLDALLAGAGGSYTVTSSPTPQPSSETSAGEAEPTAASAESSSEPTPEPAPAPEPLPEPTPEPAAASAESSSEPTPEPAPAPEPEPAP